MNGSKPSYSYSSDSDAVAVVDDVLVDGVGDVVAGAYVGGYCDDADYDAVDACANENVDCSMILLTQDLPKKNW